MNFEEDEKKKYIERQKKKLTRLKMLFFKKKEFIRRLEDVFEESSNFYRSGKSFLKLMIAIILYMGSLQFRYNEYCK